MDNGALQREQALKVKQILSQNNSRRRKRGILQTSSSLPYSHNESSSASAMPSTDPSEAGHWSTEIAEDEANWHTWNVDSNFFDINTPTTSSQDNLFGMEPSINQLQWEDDMFTGSHLTGRHDSMPFTVANGSQDFEAILPRTQNTSTVQKDGGQSASTMSQSEIHMEAISMSATELSGMNHQLYAQALNANEVRNKYPIVRTYPEYSDLGGEIDNLFMHYLDEVFYIQYPFYNSRHKQSRAWLFSILKRAKSVYYATLALSERHLLSTAEGSINLTLTNKSNYHVLALQEMGLSSGEAGWSGIASQDCTIEGITCILQLLFHEVRWLYGL